MSDYRAPIKDALFTLRHIGEIEDLAKTERYAHADYDTVASVLEEQGRFMQEVFGPLNRSGDVEGLKLADGVVTTPAGFREAYAKFVDAGWQGLNAEEEFGGAGFPRVPDSGDLEITIGSRDFFWLRLSAAVPATTEPEEAERPKLGLTLRRRG